MSHTVAYNYAVGITVVSTGASYSTEGTLRSEVPLREQWIKRHAILTLVDEANRDHQAGIAVVDPLRTDHFTYATIPAAA